MSQALSNLSFFAQLGNAPQPLPSLIIGDLRRQKHRNLQAMKGMAAKANNDQTRRPNNLDHLQRYPKKITSPQTPPIGLWERFPRGKTIEQMMETMERLMMEEQFPYSGGGYAGRGRTPWEVKEGEGEYKMRFDMPGMTKDDVKVWVEDKMLLLKAQKLGVEKEEEEEEDGKDWSAKSYGRYSFRIALPENVRLEEIKAEVRDGVLYITIPKAFSASNNIWDINVQ